MAPQKTFFVARNTARPAASRYTGPIFSVGARAFTNGAGGREDRVSLLDEKAAVVVGTLIDGSEVEILGWVPRGNATRYHVRATRSGLDGWLGVAHLRATRTVQSATSAASPTASVWIPPHVPGGKREKPAPSPVIAPVEKAPPKRKPRAKAAARK